MNLVAVEERFGSWMTQYAYANYTTSEKLMELGSVTENGFIKVGDMKYNTLVALFKPLPAEGLLKMKAPPCIVGTPLPRKKGTHEF